ncbi:MAG TPA: choice-of-anchor X domain-containing protein [Nitrolancea sp.]|nr:choice-of-anchor X domain-containing protein [Nitrolancea sp.]
MAAITVPNRPFASDIITGLALPDGFFEASLGQQRINAQFQNGGAAIGSIDLYVESVSHPGIVVTPRTYTVTNLAAGAARVLSWDADFSAAPPGTHYISFIAEDGGGHTRVIKKIFVTRVQFDPATLTFWAEAPEGTIEVRLQDLVGPKGACCPVPKNPDRVRSRAAEGQLLAQVARLFEGHRPDFPFCIPGYLLHEFDVAIAPNPPFAGQYSDLPYQDPWWKVLLCIIALILLIAAAIAEATGGSGSVTVSTGSTDTGSPVGDCCGIRAGGGGTSYLAAGLVAGAAAAATAAALSDVRDPIRRGQDNTMPVAGEITVGERLHATITYVEAVALGRPFKVQADWEYTRVTTGNTYTYSVSETNSNEHVISKEEIDAPDVVRLYHPEPWIVRAQFFDADNNPLRGADLFVQCFLIGPHGEYLQFVLQDDGIAPDDKPDDGIYTGRFDFRVLEEKARGLWQYYVIAQDVNNAQPGMSPEEAATIIGGLVRSHQLTITFDGGTCPLVPDGFVNVI